MFDIKLPGEEKNYQPDVCPDCSQPLEWHEDFMTGKFYQECTLCNYNTLITK